MRVGKSGWPKLVQQIDHEATVRDLGFDINSFVLQLSAGSVGALEPIWKPVDLKPSRHYGYALQWFGLAAVLISSFFTTDLKGLNMKISKQNSEE